MYYTFTNPRNRDELLKREKKEPVKRMKNRLTIQLTPNPWHSIIYWKVGDLEDFLRPRRNIIYVVWKMDRIDLAANLNKS